MSDQLVCVYLTPGELRALDAWHHDGGVVGEEQEKLLHSALAKLHARAVDS